MLHRGITINLNNYQSERFEIEFPAHFLPPGITDVDQAFEFVADWIERRLGEVVARVVAREAARGNYIDAPAIGTGTGPAMRADAY